MVVSQSHITNVSWDALPVHHPNTILESWPDAPVGQRNQRDHPLNRGQVMSKPHVAFLPRQSAVTGQGPVKYWIPSMADRLSIWHEEVCELEGLFVLIWFTCYFNGFLGWDKKPNKHPNIHHLVQTKVLFQTYGEINGKETNINLKRKLSIVIKD